MEDKDNIIKQQAAYIRELVWERDRWKDMAQEHEKEIQKLYAVLYAIPEASVCLPAASPGNHYYKRIRRGDDRAHI